VKGPLELLAIVRLSEIRDATAAAALDDALRELCRRGFGESETTEVFTPSRARIVETETGGNLLAEM
jgi:hypothetical protein